MAMRVAGLLVVVAVVGWGLFVQAGGVGASRFKVFTVEVSEMGFNPPVCQISRDNYIQFKNVGKGAIRVIRHGSGDALTFDSGLLSPGQVSNQDFFPFGSSAIYRDSAREEHFLRVVLPVLTPTWDEICDPRPELRPGISFACQPVGNCAVLPALARDR